MEADQEIVETSLLVHNVNKTKTYYKDVIWYKRKRYYVTLLTCAGMCMAFVLRINLSIALVEMTSFKNITTFGNRTVIREPEFKWNSVEKGFVLSSFSWGYMFSFVGGLLTSKFGGTRVFGLGIVIPGVLTILTPILIRSSVTIYILARIVEGLAESFSWASIMEIILYWMPPHERSRLSAITFAGTYIAPAVAYPLCGFTTKHYGWESAFFVTGGLTVGWFIMWRIFVSRTPATDWLITEDEMKFMIQQVNVLPVKKLKYPWKKIFTSAPLWAYLNERFVQAWSLSFMLYCLPLYVKDMQNVNIDSVGYISSLPHVCAIFGILFSACLADYLRNRQIWSITKVHKFLVAVTQISCIILLIIMTIWMDFTVIIICICLFKTVYTLATVSYSVLPNDMGLHYSSLINGLATTAVSIGYILNPIIMGLLVTNHTAVEWSRYFIFLSGFNVLGGVIFCVFGSGELQPWAIPKEDGVEQNKKIDEKETSKSLQRSIYSGTF